MNRPGKTSKIASPTSHTQYYECSRLLKLEPVLRQWIRVIKKYHSIGDEPWTYRERTQVGFFAAATWLSGSIALEEWHTEKGPVTASRKGRCDLWIKIGDYHFEAKHRWCNVTGDPDKEERDITSAVSQAIECALELNCDNGKRLALVFLSPCFLKRAHGDLSKLLDEWLSNVHSQPHDAIAWYFPKRHGLTSLPDSPKAVGSVLLIKRP